VSRHVATELEHDNSLRPIPVAPLGLAINLARLPDPPTPERVRLGRWLFFDTRLPADGSLACSSCHQPQFAFSQRTAVATGIGGRQGRRKVRSIINLGVPPQSVNFQRAARTSLLWDGRAPSLEVQAPMPVADANEMGNTHDAMVSTIAASASTGPTSPRRSETPGSRTNGLRTPLRTTNARG
jgi:cytochrome c peroxidase